LVTLYFWRKNIIGIHESSEKALRIMQITTVMVVILIAGAWSRFQERLPARAAARSRQHQVQPRGAGLAEGAPWRRRSP
jgi:hypothetical protein